MIKKVKSLIKSFQFAINGLIIILKTQRNAKIIFGLGLLAIILGIYLRIPNSEFLIIILTVGLVFIAEIFNTLVEETQNIFSKKAHPQVKMIKDMAAGAVLIAAIISLAVGYFIFVKRFFCF
ncbi:MAG: diacylglycerol kinase family protein [Candidatus Omnitrophica bacterium]|nr:diacylglycerol kinase family protein [Candidatus Omnitrophota bacterium]